MSNYCIITTVCNKEEVANNIINTLLEKRLVSCCQKSNIQSTYWWKGKIEKDSEIFIQMKTRKELYNEVEAEILKLHDYETCEILSYDIEQGNKEFLDWIDEETNK